jgi:hypothetical protein
MDAAAVERGDYDWWASPIFGDDWFGECARRQGQGLTALAPR